MSNRTVLVNKEWEYYLAGTKVVVADIEYEIGVNAFGSVVEALEGVADHGTIKILSVGGVQTEYAAAIDFSEISVDARQKAISIVGETDEWGNNLILQTGAVTLGSVDDNSSPLFYGTSFANVDFRYKSGVTNGDRLVTARQVYGLRFFRCSFASDDINKVLFGIPDAGATGNTGVAFDGCSFANGRVQIGDVCLNWKKTFGLKIFNSNFEDVCIDLDEVQEVTIDGCEFVADYAKMLGGGILEIRGGTAESVVLRNNKFTAYLSEGGAGEGGVIWINNDAGAEVVIEGNDFSGCKEVVLGQGGEAAVIKVSNASGDEATEVPVAVNGNDFGTADGDELLALMNSDRTLLLAGNDGMAPEKVYIYSPEDQEQLTGVVIETIVVNSAFSGELYQPLEEQEGLHFGVNAFDNLSDAIHQAAKYSTDVRIVLQSDVDFKNFTNTRVKANLTIVTDQAGGVVVHSDGGASGLYLDMAAGCTFQLGDGITWENAGQALTGYGLFSYHTFQVDGVMNYQDDNSFWVYNNTTKITPSGQLRLAGDNVVRLRGNSDLLIDGQVEDTAAAPEGQHKNIDGGGIAVDQSGQRRLVLTNACVYTSGVDVDKNTRGAFELSMDKSLLQLTGAGDISGLTIAETASQTPVTITIANQSRLDASQASCSTTTEITVEDSVFAVQTALKNAGVITVDNSASLTAGELTNAGVITVDNTASLTAGALTNTGAITVDNTASLTAGDLTNAGAITVNNSALAIEKLVNTDGDFVISGDCTLDVAMAAGSTVTAADGTTLRGNAALYAGDDESQLSDDAQAQVVAEGAITVGYDTTLAKEVVLVVGRRGKLNVVVDSDELPGDEETLVLLNNVSLGRYADVSITVVDSAVRDEPGISYAVNDENVVVIDGCDYQVTVDEDGMLEMTQVREPQPGDPDFVYASLTDFAVTQADDGYYFVLDGVFDAGSDPDAVMTLTVTGPRNFLGVPTYAVVTGSTLAAINTQLRKKPFITNGDSSLAIIDLTFTLTLDGRFYEDEQLAQLTPVTIVDKTAPALEDDVAVEVKQDTAVVTWSPGEDNVGVVSYTVAVVDEDGNTVRSFVVAADEVTVNDDGKLEVAFAELTRGDYTAVVTASDAQGLATTAVSESFEVTTVFSNPTTTLFFVGALGGDDADDVMVVTKSPDTYDGTTGEAVAHAELSAAVSANGTGTQAAPFWDANWWMVSDFGDINGDGTDDAILQLFSDDGNSVEVGAICNGEFVSLRIFDTSQWEVVGLGDLDGDGHDELVAWQPSTDSTGSERTEREVLTSSFHDNGGHDRDSVLNTTTSGDWQVLTFADVANVNASNDYVVLHNATTGTIAYWSYNSSGTLTQYTLGTIDDSTNWEFLGAGDFNNDGKDDLLWLDDDDNLVWSNSNSRCKTEIIGSINDPALNGYTLAGVGDFNNDGTDDLLWSSSTTLAWSTITSNYSTLNQYLTM